MEPGCPDFAVRNAVINELHISSTMMEYVYVEVEVRKGTGHGEPLKPHPLLLE